MLACRWYNSEAKSTKCLVWLHGLLGNQADWQTIIAKLPDWPSLTIDLPYHGASVNIDAISIMHVEQLIQETLYQQAIKEYILIGYSLGGRLAMHHYCQRYRQTVTANHPILKAIVIEGGHPGLTDDAVRQQRLAHDKRWAQRFQNQPITQVLNAWYQQTLFMELDDKTREQLIKLRQYNNGNAIARMLIATSLAHQKDLMPMLSSRLVQNPTSFCYLVGEYDHKFQQLAQNYQLPCRTITGAGHNAHYVQPNEFVRQLSQFLKEHN